MRCAVFAFLIFLTSPFLHGAETVRLVGELMNDQRELASVPFTEVVKAATGKQVLAMNPTNAADRELLAKIGRALDAVLRKLNAPGGPAQEKRRINEVSALFEAALKAELNAIEGFECDYPKLVSGARQRA
ncbi:MAG TPA: hypothetical protein VK846_18470, partial [Candidatus Limnocylindria bacterium]|nr:hypothetical protein [Candidatus Limnocylindria bacterium]